LVHLFVKIIDVDIVQHQIVIIRLAIWSRLLFQISFLFDLFFWRWWDVIALKDFVFKIIEIWKTFAACFFEKSFFGEFSKNFGFIVNFAKSFPKAFSFFFIGLVLELFGINLSLQDLLCS
jgi:hypothetical protein